MAESTENKTKSYSRIKLFLTLMQSVLSFALLLYFVGDHKSIIVRDWALGLSTNSYTTLLFFVVLFGMPFIVLGSVVNFISGFWLEHHFKLSNQSLGGWLGEKVKETLLVAAIVLPLLELFYFFLRNYPQSWWVWMGSALFIFSILLGKLAPRFIFPLFYKFDKLEDPGLFERMQRLAREGNFAIDGVYRFNMSKTTKKANAAFTGIGKTKRIIMGDTLLENFSADEIETVFAHEVGHYVHKHIQIGIVMGALITFGSLYLAQLVYMKSIAILGFSGTSDLAALPVLSIILTLISMMVTPFNNALSRHHEYQADRYALTHSSHPEVFAGALQKLAKINLSDPEPSVFVEFLFHGHPSVKKRTEYADNVLAKQGISHRGNFPINPNNTFR